MPEVKTIKRINRLPEYNGCLALDGERGNILAGDPIRGIEQQITAGRNTG